MKFIMFTKHLEGRDLPGIMDALKSAGVQGADLCTRPGYPVNPDNCSTALPEAAKQFADQGLSIDIITTPGDFTEPTVAYTEPLMAAAKEAGAERIKLGYWRLTKPGYWELLDECRTHMDGFAKLAEKHGVKVMVHNHSGSSMGLNSSAVMRLVEGFDPKHVGVFTDVGHLSLVGEPLPMAIDIVKDYISAIAFKDLRKEPTTKDGKRVMQLKVVPLGMGFVEFSTALKLIQDYGLDIPVSMHCEYSGYPVDSVVDQCRIDMRYIQGLLDAL